MIGPAHWLYEEFNMKSATEPSAGFLRPKNYEEEFHG